MNIPSDLFVTKYCWISCRVILTSEKEFTLWIVSIPSRHISMICSDWVDDPEYHWMQKSTINSVSFLLHMLHWKHYSLPCRSFYGLSCVPSPWGKESMMSPESDCERGYKKNQPANFVFVNTRQNSGNGIDFPPDVSLFTKCTLKNHPDEK